MQKTLSYQQSYYNEYFIALACLVPLLSFFFVQVYGGHLQLDPYFSATIDLFSLGGLLPHYGPCDDSLENSCFQIFK